MTIDEAINHAEETAETRTDLCKECRAEHKQLAEWLKELKQLRADVVPRSEVEKLTEERDRYKKYYYRHEYDEWEAEIKREIAKEIFEEIAEALQGEIDTEDKRGREAWEQSDIEGYHIHEYAEDKLDTLKIAFSLYKKKYIGE